MTDEQQQRGCDGCGGNPGTLFLHSRCHPTKPTWVEWDTDTRVAHVICAECKRGIASLGAVELVTVEIRSAITKTIGATLDWVRENGLPVSINPTQEIVEALAAAGVWR